MLIASFRTLGILADPGVLLAIGVLASLLAVARGWWRSALCFQLAATSIVILFGILPGGVWLALPLEQRFTSSARLPDHVAGIIALGGTERLAQSAFWNQPSLRDPAPIAALVALGRRYPDAKLAFSGGAHARGAPLATEARIVRGFLDQMGVGSERIIYEDRSRNTLENARFTHDLIQPDRTEPWILVTQAISLPRAVATFRHAGWNVVPFPAGYLSGSDGGVSVRFDIANGFHLTAIALHEWGGLLVYRLLNYTDEFFPR